MTDGADDTSITASVVDDLTAAYGRSEPFDMVEREHIQTLPPAFASGEFGRRDAEWVVQWYYRRRRRVGTISDVERREAEDRFLENGYDAVVGALQNAAATTDREEGVGHLADLDGVDIAVASAFLAFTHPDRYVAIGRSEWEALRAAGELDGSYPDGLTVGVYGRYLDAIRRVVDRVDRDPWDVYRAVWQLGVADDEV